MTISLMQRRREWKWSCNLVYRVCCSFWADFLVSFRAFFMRLSQLSTPSGAGVQPEADHATIWCTIFINLSHFMGCCTIHSRNHQHRQDDYPIEINHKIVRKRSIRKTSSVTLKNLQAGKILRALKTNSQLELITSKHIHERWWHQRKEFVKKQMCEETLNGLNNRELTWLDVINSWPARDEVNER